MTDKKFLPKDNFFDVCRNGTAIDIQNAIAAGADVNIRWAYNNPIDKDFTPLMVAVCENPHFGVVSELIKAGADVDAQDANGWTALMWAVLHTKDIDFVEILLDAKADVNLKDNDKKTILMLALQNNIDSDVISMLIDEIGVNSQDKNGQTALMYAVRYAVDSDVILDLIDKGANPSIEDNQGCIALDFWRQQEENFPREIASEIIRRLTIDVHDNE